MVLCELCGNEFEVTKSDQEHYQRFAVPQPRLCRACREQRRLSFREEKFLYSDVCDLCEKPMLSTFSQEKTQKVYCHECWWSDKWDPLDYGIEYDSSELFFDLMKKLIETVPFFNLYNTGSENCEYTNYAAFNKNSYLTFGSWKSENCLYCETALSCKDLVDCHFCNQGEKGYEQIDSNKNYNCCFLQNSENNSDSWFLFDCQGCNNCIGCSNLRNKSYHLWNKPCTKEEFERAKTSFRSRRELVKFKSKFWKFIEEEAIHPHITGIKNENVSGDLIFNSKNVQDSYSVYESEEVYHSSKVGWQKYCVDGYGVGEGELVYDSLSNDYAYNSKFICTGLHMKESNYCMHCYNCNDVFGCVSLRNKQYCILNKQYSKEEYESLVPKIIADMTLHGEWGEFFPTRISPYDYNESQAAEYYPMTREEVLERGWKWHKEEQKHFTQDFEVADNIDDVGDEILAKKLVCEECARNFKIILQELEFYRKTGLPIPLKCFYCRHKERLSHRAKHRLYDRQCSKCSAEIKSPIAPERHEKVYCKKCYFEELY